MLWYIFISIIIFAQNGRDFNERTIYKYVGKVKGTNAEWCCAEGLANMRSHYYSLNWGGQEAITRTGSKPWLSL